MDNGVRYLFFPKNFRIMVSGTFFPGTFFFPKNFRNSTASAGRLGDFLRPP